MKTKYLLIALFLMVALTGCIFQDEVATNEIAVETYKNEIEAVRGPGVYTRLFCVYCDLRVMTIDTLTFSVDDPEVLTSDNQAVGVKITIQARRKNDDKSVENIYTQWSSLTNNDALIATISATAREGMKNGTRGFTLTQLLDDRNGLADAIRGQLELDAEKYSVEIINVTVENIAPSAEYMAILGQTANIKAETDKEKRRQDLINQQAANDVLAQQQRVKVADEQLKAEQAETLVQVEIAERQGEIVKASNQVYADNPFAFELERLRLMKDVIGDKSVIYLPSDVTLHLFQGFGNSTPVPVTP